ncbi:uncharacterized protein LOC125817112 [Solanum verrucosum]|uniref:uncharacterized protein LOC125817112 n=1 Tax=Solanum verrucosum TaxID=315347 RepID=UPI0020D11765|nr:uncharacterized protein LOC125817112 [Solanum verrucosum]
MKHPSDIHVVSTIDVNDEAVASLSHLMCMSEPLESVLANDDEFEVQGYKEVVAALLGMGNYSKTPLKLDIHPKNQESPHAKPSKEEPPNLELKVLPSDLRYSFLGVNNTLPVIIKIDLLEWQLKLLLEVLRRHINAIGWTIAKIVGIPPGICTHKIDLDSDCKLSVEHQRRLNPQMQEVVKEDIIKLLDAGVIYPIVDIKWVSPVQCVPKKGGLTVVPNENGGLVSMRPVTGWRICMYYQKLYSWTEKDHFPMLFMDQILNRLSERGWYCFLDWYYGHNQISIAPKEQEKTTFTCLYGTFAFKRMPFELCNASATFQCCMFSIFADMVDDSMEVFMDDFSVVGDIFEACFVMFDVIN